LAQFKDFFTPSLLCVFQDGYGQRIEKLIHDEDGQWHFLSFLFCLVILLNQILQFRKPFQSYLFEFILSDEFFSQRCGILIVEPEKGFILFELIHNIFLLFLAIVLRN